MTKRWVIYCSFFTMENTKHEMEHSNLGMIDAIRLENFPWSRSILLTVHCAFLTVHCAFNSSHGITNKMTMLLLWLSPQLFLNWKRWNCLEEISATSKTESIMILTSKAHISPRLRVTSLVAIFHQRSIQPSKYSSQMIC